MNDAPDTDWLTHDGGGNPAPGCLVEVEFRAGSRSTRPKPSDVWKWEHTEHQQYSGADIVHYRVARHLTPRERRTGKVERTPAPPSPTPEATTASAVGTKGLRGRMTPEQLARAYTYEGSIDCGPKTTTTDAASPVGTQSQSDGVNP